jgi:hypothetical protein
VELSNTSWSRASVLSLEVSLAGGIGICWVVPLSLGGSGLGVLMSLLGIAGYCWLIAQISEGVCRDMLNHVGLQRLSSTVLGA